MKAELINDLTHLFDKEGFKENMQCPFCLKTYKSKRGYDNHMKKIEENGYEYCADPVLLFSDTPTEEYAFRLLQVASSICGTYSAIRIGSFRLSKNYRLMNEFALFCMEKQLPDKYLNFVYSMLFRANQVNILIGSAMKEKNVSSYHYYLRHNEAEIDSEEFHARNQERLYDNAFLVSSLRRGKIGFSYAFDKLNFSERYCELDPSLAIQIDTLLEEKYYDPRKRTR